MKKILWVVLLAVSPLILSACSSPAPPEPLEVAIDMTEYAFQPSNLEFQVGQEVTIQLANSGVLDHEIMFGREVMMTDGHPNGYMIDMFETANVEPVVTVENAEADEDETHTEGDEHDAAENTEEDDHAEDEHADYGFMVKVPVTHDTYTMKFTVTADMLGEWEIGCFLLDGVHYNSGMVGSLTVTK